MVFHDDETVYSFRLSQGDEVYSDTSTLSSTHKQQIDSLFRDKRPRQTPTTPTIKWSDNPGPIQNAREELEQMFGGRDQRQRAFLDVRATVQAQIERLFADATTEPLPSAASRPIPQPIQIQPVQPPPPPTPPRSPTPTPSPSPSPSPLPPPAHTPSPSGSQGAQRSESPGSGSPSVLGGISNAKFPVQYLGSLQLSQKATSLDVLQAPLLQLYYHHRLALARGGNGAGGTLQITEAGLRVCHGPRETLGGARQFTNPFPTIAVWAAVKLVVRRDIGSNGRAMYSYAFLPLICDPEAQDKYNLYHPLGVSQPGILLGGQHPPMFACVMRRVGVPRVLECHGFLCQSPEDAIVMAANLYQALLHNMQPPLSNPPSDGPSDGPSDAPSDVYSDVPDDERHVFSDSEAVPVRPPRRKRASRASRRGHSPGGMRRASSEDMLHDHPLFTTSRNSSRRLRRAVSEREVGLTLGSEGDIYTKVALPRSRSFMSVSDKYSFTDLVGPNRSRPAVLDQLLRQVVTPRGMSFTEMQPAQRQVLMQLALTLSKDELYKRSKSIMRQQTRARGSEPTSGNSDTDTSTITSVLRATKRSFSRLGSRASNLGDKSPLRRLVISRSRNSLDQAGRGGVRRIPKTPMPRRSTSGYQSCSECGYDSECSSKCYCSLPRRGTLSNPRQPPCDCDTESCAESEKCYCSLKRVKKDGLKMYEINLDSETDTNTEVTVRGKYRGRDYGSQDDLSQAGSRRSLSSLNRLHSPDPPMNHKTPPRSDVQTHQAQIHHKAQLHTDIQKPIHHKTPNMDLKSQSRRTTSPIRDYGTHDSRRLRKAPDPPLLLSPRLRRHPSGSLGSGGSRGSRGSSDGSDEGSTGQQKILLVSAVDPSGKVVYRGASQNPRPRHNQSPDTASILSMKKTAEIAALFSELKLNQTTDLLHHHSPVHSDHTPPHSDDDAYSTMLANNSFLFSDNIETSLGYLP